MNTLKKFFGLYSCREDNIKLLIKVNSVLRSCETKDQYNVAKKYARLVYDKLKVNLHKDHSFGFTDGYIYLSSMVKAIHSDFEKRSRYLNIKYLPVIY